MTTDTEVAIDAGEWREVLRLIAPFTGRDEAESLGFVRLRGAGGRRRWIGATPLSMAVLDAGPWDEDLDVGVPRRAVSSAVAMTHIGRSPRLLIRAGSDGQPASVGVRSEDAEVELPLGIDPYPDVDALLSEARTDPQATAGISAAALELLIAGAREMPAGVHLGDGDPGPLFWVELADGRITITTNWGPYGTTRYAANATVSGAAAVAVDPALLHDLASCAVEIVGDDDVNVVVSKGNASLVMSAAHWTGCLFPFDTSVERLRPALEQMLRDLGLGDPRRDHDGDYPIAVGTSSMYVRLVGADPRRAIAERVQVFAVVLDGVDSSPELLTELNALNQGTGFARAFHVSGQVLVEVELLAHTLDHDELDNAFRIVGGLVNDLGPFLAGTFT